MFDPRDPSATTEEMNLWCETEERRGGEKREEEKRERERGEVL
jgi:hypothetical protein